LISVCRVPLPWKRQHLKPDIEPHRVTVGHQRRGGRRAQINRFDTLLQVTTRGSELIDRYYSTLAAGNIEALAEFYSPDALVIRFDGTSTGMLEILDFFSKMYAEHGQYVLQSLDQVTESGDVLMWDALVTTSNGVVQVTEVLVLDDDGKIRRHIPGFRGYWGM
jgi:hypothetical protein